MPQHVTYLAVREIATGHSASSTYDLDLELKAKEISWIVDRNIQRSLSGKAFITYNHSARRWACQTIPLTGLQAEYMREFLNSAIDAIFTFSPNTASSTSPPGDTYSVYIEGNTIKQKRAGRTGVEANDYFTYSFSMRQHFA